MKFSNSKSAQSLFALALGSLLASCGQPDAPAASPAATMTFNVETTPSKVRDVSRLISLPGDVKPWQETTLSGKVQGFLTTISVDKGDIVKSGQILAVIGTPELEADKEQALQNYKANSAAVEGNLSASAKSGEEVARAKSAKLKATADLGQSVATVSKSRAQLRQAKAAVTQAVEQKKQAVATLEESRSRVRKAESDVTSAQADQQLADVTYHRYLGIYNKNPELIAKQDVDIAETKAIQAKEKVTSAKSELDASKQKVAVSQSQVSSADSLVAQANEQVTIAEEQIKLSLAAQESAKRQVDVVSHDVDISAKQRDVTHADVAKSRFQANAGKSALDRQTSMAGYAQIRAPFDGVVTKRFVDQGALIQNAAPVFTVANVNQVRIYLNVPETEVRFIQVGGVVHISLTGRPDDKIDAKITRTSAALDPKTRTMLAEIDLPNADGKILAGSYATARIVLETHPGVVSIPSAAVGSDKSGKFVFVNDGGKAKRLPIKVGFDDGTFTEITEGLKADADVVVVGRDALNPGVKLSTKPWDPTKKPKT